MKAIFFEDEKTPDAGWLARFVRAIIMSSP
jgi:hypothetical protein